MMGEEPKKPVWGPEDLPASKPRPAAGKPIALPAKAGDDAAGGQEATARPLQMAIAQRAQRKAVEPAPSVGAKEEPAPAPRPEPPATAKRAEPVHTTAHAASDEATSAAATNPAAASSASVI